MQVATIFQPESGDILGMVTPVKKDIDFNKFYTEVKRRWIDFQKTEIGEEGGYTIEDFVDYHNDISKIEIDWVINENIQ